MAPLRRNAAEFRQRLLQWFDHARRDLPWRKTTDPYRILVSEIMLQQTQVERVVDYFDRFVAAFPDARALAAASRGDVLKIWEGLGYYGRARALHQTAAVVCREHDAHIPSTATGLRSLPGIGPYTSAAVASIAFGERIAVIDTNVVRVLARLARVDGDTSKGEGRARLARLADELLDPKRPGDFNQAMMELGATVCRPRSPDCSRCPVADRCGARRSGRPDQWPTATPAPERPTVVAACALVRRRGRLLVVRRPEKGLLGGLWEFPGARLRDGESADDACVRGVREKTGVFAQAGPRLGVVTHGFSHFRVTLEAIECVDLGGRARHGRWMTHSEIEALALTRTARRLLPKARRG